MSYLVFARKYRPDSFQTVSGQEHVTQTLANAIERDCVAHAYVFSGPRGVGKTSIARIFAKSLNCEKGPTAEPCLKCRNCEEITRGTSLAVREIDGASHNSVDNVRELIESFRSLPAPGTRYKVYIIDEVHMLSISAFNALLKSLEEPPPNTIFILATTEPHKIPDTVMSRCQRHDFRALGLDTIQARLREIASQEELEIDDESLATIARLAEGSMRDAQTLLDRVRSFCEGAITAEDTSRALGTVGRRALFELSASIFERKPSDALRILQGIFASGIDTTLFLKEFVSHFREIFIARFANEADVRDFGILAHDAEEMKAQVANVSDHDVQDLVHVARSGADAALRSMYPKYAFESLVVRLATREPVKDMGEVLAKMRTVLKERRKDSAPAPKAAPLRKQAPAVPHAPSERSPQPETPAACPDTGVELDWQEFVTFVAGGTSQLLAEHLRRVSADTFQPGTLKARGPEFQVSCLSDAEARKKLEQALHGFCPGQAQWSVVFESGAERGTVEPGSLLHSEESARSEDRKQKTESVVNHPSVRSLREHFPGSKIESIRLKGNEIRGERGHGKR